MLVKNTGSTKWEVPGKKGDVTLAPGAVADVVETEWTTALLISIGEFAPQEPTEKKRPTKRKATKKAEVKNPSFGNW